MGSREARASLIPLLTRSWRSSICGRCVQLRRTLATQATSPGPIVDDELVPFSSLDDPIPAMGAADDFDPLKPSRERKRQLPRSRYQYKSPKYDRGPLHPHRPPRPSDPASREFIPGPFSTSRLEATYHNIIAPDILTLCYQHNPPGFRPPPRGPRLRDWGDESPYHKNRPLRGPRGGDVLRLLRKPITFRNIPKLERVTVHSFVSGVIKGGSAYLHAAGMIVQAITNVRVRTHKAKTSVADWGLIKGKHSISVTAELRGEDMYHFLSKLIHVVMPKIKDWTGVRATTGDSSGNITLGFEPEVVGTFPEVEINYDSYPPKMIPGCHITIHTSANTDKDARLLLQTIGIPFYGKIVD